MNTTHRGFGLKQTILENKYAYGAVVAIVLGLMAPITYFSARALEAGNWFALILAVVVAVLSFCCLKVWLEDESGLGDIGESNNSYIILAGTLSFVGIILTYITLNIYPFGDHTVLIIDMHHQYVAFFALLRERLLGGGSWLYSDNIGLGSGFLPLFAYYIASPFNLLTLIFPRTMLTEAIALITILKITTAGVTFAIFARHMLRRNDFSVVVCGIGYSLMAFLLCHSWNIMWLDPILLLPIVVLGLEKLLRTGKPALYCIALAAALITNYYIGYMVCIFLVLYYFVHVLSDSRELSLMDRAQRFWRFCYGSLIGGGISAVIILPAFYYLRSTSGAEDAFARDLATNFNILSLFQRSLFSAYPSMRGDNLPNIYCSVLALFALLLFVTCRNIPLRRRIAWGGAVLTLALSMSVNWLNFAWHGFHFPNDLPYRFSFLLSFAMLCVLMQVLGNLDKLTPRGVVGSLVALIAMLLLEQQFGDGEADFTMIYASLAFLLVYAAIVALCSAGKLRQTLCYAILLVFLFVELTANASVLMQTLDQNEYFTERENFVYDYEVNDATFELIDSFGDDMYREELLSRKTCNDPALFGYDGLTVFASSNRKSVTTLMGKLGYAVNGVNSYLYKNFVPVSDSMLALKYIALDKEVNGHHQRDVIQTVSAADDSGITNYRYIHKNTKALSKAFLVNKSIIGWQWDNNNPFVVQNALLTSATGSTPVYNLVEMYGDSNFSDSGGYDEFNGDTGVAIDGIDPAVNSKTSISGFNSTGSISGTYFSCSKLNEELDANMTIEHTVANSGQYFIYVDCRAAESLSIATSAAGSEQTTTISASPNEPNIVDLGYISAGGRIAVTINSEISCGGNIFLATLNEEVFNAAIEQLSLGQLEVERYREGNITGTVNAVDSRMMFTSIPYDSGWTVRIDGKKVDTFALGDALLCFEVPAGEHTVKMTYFPSCLIVGIIISLLSIAILVVLLVPKLRERALDLLYPERKAVAAQGAQPVFPRVAFTSSALTPALDTIDDTTPDGFEDDFSDDE